MERLKITSGRDLPKYFKNPVKYNTGSYISVLTRLNVEEKVILIAPSFLYTAKAIHSMIPSPFLSPPSSLSRSLSPSREAAQTGMKDEGQIYIMAFFFFLSVHGSSYPPFPSSLRLAISVDRSFFPSFLFSLLFFFMFRPWIANERTVAVVVVITRSL